MAGLRAVAGHEVFTGHLDDLSEASVRQAATGRLGGLLSWHPTLHDTSEGEGGGGGVSAHPLVRAVLRPLALGAAPAAVEASLTGIPGQVTSREEGLRVVEAIELLLDADQWQTADDLYTSRTRNGALWQWLPAVGLGQRAAAAFVATPARRAACPDRLTPTRFSWYLNEVGLYAQNAGDLDTALEYLQAGADHDRAAGDQTRLSSGLQNLAEAHGWSGRLEPARAAAAEALTLARQITDRRQETYSLGWLGWLAGLAGDTPAADTAFGDADRLEHADRGRHLYSRRGVRWGEFLARTGRVGPARRLAEANRRISAEQGWNENVARCDRVLARLDLTAAADTVDGGDAARAREAAVSAVEVFRAGEYLVELAETLPVLAAAALADGDPAAALVAAGEAITLAGPRHLPGPHAAALVARGRVHAHAGQTGKARDDADAALRIARRHGLAWPELDAVDLHADLDSADGVHPSRWAAEAAGLRRRLVPDGLDPDPLATIEREEREADPDGGEDDGGGS